MPFRATICSWIFTDSTLDFSRSFLRCTRPSLTSPEPPSASSPPPRCPHSPTATQSPFNHPSHAPPAVVRALVCPRRQLFRLQSTPRTRSDTEAHPAPFTLEQVIKPFHSALMLQALFHCKMPRARSQLIALYFVLVEWPDGSQIWPQQSSVMCHAPPARPVPL